MSKSFKLSSKYVLKEIFSFLNSYEQIYYSQLNKQVRNKLEFTKDLKEIFICFYNNYIHLLNNKEFICKNKLAGKNLLYYGIKYFNNKDNSDVIKAYALFVNYIQNGLVDNAYSIEYSESEDLEEIYFLPLLKELVLKNTIIELSSTLVQSLKAIINSVITKSKDIKFRLSLSSEQSLSHFAKVKAYLKPNYTEIELVTIFDNYNYTDFYAYQIRNLIISNFTIYNSIL